MASTQSTEQRFWAKVQKTDTCWLWIAGKNSLKYGTFWANPKVVLAHRFSYELAFGPVPEGLDLDHLCRVSSCVNPDHLEPVTHQENCRRGLTGAHLAKKTHCPQGHEYTPENTYDYGKNGRTRRYCKTCIFDRTRARRAAIKKPEGYCRHGHEMTEANIYRWKDEVHCRECRRNADRRRMTHRSRI